MAGAVKKETIAKKWSVSVDTIDKFESMGMPTKDNKFIVADCENWIQENQIDILDYQIQDRPEPIGTKTEELAADVSQEEQRVIKCKHPGCDWKKGVALKFWNTAGAKSGQAICRICMTIHDIKSGDALNLDLDAVEA